MAQPGACCEPQNVLLAKIVMAGEPDVGKTAILRRYTQTSQSQPASLITTVATHTDTFVSDAAPSPHQI
ncbi:UNVERIFIED_CONTAM: hypothetical protein K2H54_047496 [Gekko kuhli]